MRHWDGLNGLKTVYSKRRGIYLKYTHRCFWAGKEKRTKIEHENRTEFISGVFF